MIESDIVNRIRKSTCAIVYLPVKHEEIGIKTGDDVNVRVDLRVLGTGFVIDSTLILTNRHIIEEIHKNEQNGNLENWYVLFTYSDKPGQFTEHFVRMKYCFAMPDPENKGRLDAGIISLRSEDSLDKINISPVVFGELDSVIVGEEVALCGFPFGNEILENELGLSRFGPVIHRGIISAVSPFDSVNARQITSFLTDLNSAPGMSGSPIFFPNTGEVIGLHYFGAQGTIGAAIPFDKARVDTWIRAFNEIVIKKTDSIKLIIKAGGDLELLVNEE